MALADRSRFVLYNHDAVEGPLGDLHPDAGTGAPDNLRDWAYWRPEAEEHGHGDGGGGSDGSDGSDGSGNDLHRYMAAPPPGREAFAINPATIDKAPLLFYHLLDLAESMEAHGLAAHAAAPLAIAELVARLCLGRDTKAATSSSEAGEGAAEIANTGKGGGGGEGAEAGEGHPAAANVFPALALACLRRSRLLLKLGPT